VSKHADRDGSALRPEKGENYMNRGLMLSITLCFILSNGTAIAGSTTFVSGKSQRTESDVLALRSSAVNHPI
jgi:hypothetical protein